MDTTYSPRMLMIKVCLVVMVASALGLALLGGLAVEPAVETVVEAVVKPHTNARPDKLVKHAEAIRGYELMEGTSGTGCYQAWIYYNQALGNIAYICQYTHHQEPFMCIGVIMVASEGMGTIIHSPGDIADRTCYAMTCERWFYRLASEGGSVYTPWNQIDPVMRSRLELGGWTFEEVE